MHIRRLLRTSFPILLLTVLVIQAPSPLPSIPEAEAVTRSILLRGDTSGWNFSTPSPTIRVTHGDNLIMNLTKEDSPPHQFLIDVDGSGFNCGVDKCSNFVPDPDYRFTVDFAPMNYTYYCTVHPFMQGSFIVEGFTVKSNPSSIRVLQGSSNTSTVTVSGVNGFTGTVNLTAIPSPSGPGTSFNASSVVLPAGGFTTSELTVSTTGSTPLGSYTVRVSGNSSSSYSTASLDVFVVTPDFSISANPSFLELPLGSSGTSTITLTSLESFSDNVDLSAGPLPIGVSAIFTPNTVPLAAGSTATSSLNITVGSTTPPGSYRINVTGVSGSRSHVTTLTLVAGPDFGLSTTPNSIMLTPGTSGSSTVTISSFNGFTGNVTLSSGSLSSGISTGVSPARVNLPAGGTLTATLTMITTSATSAANYTVTVNGTSGGKSHGTVVDITVVDFTIAASSASLTLSNSATVNVTVTVTGLNGFSGQVDLASTTSSALSHSLDTSAITVVPGAPVTTTLRIGWSSAQDGTYTVTITGTQGGLSRSTNISVSVLTPQTPSDFSIHLLFGAMAGIIAVLAVLLYVRTKRRAKT